MGGDRDSLIGDAKQNKDSIPHSPWAGSVQLSSGKPGSIVSDGGLGRQRPSFLFLLLPQLYPRSMMSVWGIPGVTWGQLSRLCPLPSPCAPPASLVGWVRSRRGPGSVRALLSNNQTFPVLPTLFPAQTQTMALYKPL